MAHIIFTVGLLHWFLGSSQDQLKESTCCNTMNTPSIQISVFFIGQKLYDEVCTVFPPITRGGGGGGGGGGSELTPGLY